MGNAELELRRLDETLDAQQEVPMEIRGLGPTELPILRKGQSRSITPENPTGSKGGGARSMPGETGAFGQYARHLGQGWKVNPCIHVGPGESARIAEVVGPGILRHLWFTAVAVGGVPGDPAGTLIPPDQIRLRVWWDDEDDPSVDAPLGDFFASFFNLTYDVASTMVAIAPLRSLNCYWPMPFAKRAMVAVENQSSQTLRLYYQFDYELSDVPSDAGYFHAQFRESLTPEERPEHVILDSVRGHGHYVGTAIGWESRTELGPTGWWGEGEVKFFIDGDDEFPTICGTGTEDYFCGACGFGDGGLFRSDSSETGVHFSYALMGLPYNDTRDQPLAKRCMYRWHLPDPIIFHQDLGVTIQTMGWHEDADGPYWLPLTDRIRSVAYWYQTEPHAAFPMRTGAD